MAKIVTVVGATGIQGGSVVRALLNEPSYSIRAITRDSKSDAAKALAEKGVEVVEADINKPDTLLSAFAGSYAIFAVTDYFGPLVTEGIYKSMDIESEKGINLANAAAATDSLKHYIWSSLPNSHENSGGKIVVPYYESKNRVDRHIKSIPHLLSKTTFAWFSWYAGNMNYPLYQPSPINSMDGEKLYVQLVGASPTTTLLPLMGDERTNVGLFVKAILDQPEKTLPGRIVRSLVEQWSISELVSTFASVHKIRAHCLQISEEDYAKIYPIWGELLNINHRYMNALGGQAFTSTVEQVVTKDDLGIKGLVGTAEAFAAIKLLN
ncbi:unnamed protein product [Clonostachys byssicola]|uniref:NmrA-like domain-containing protein n=1 Tax=Clonostachys byssicola TaxID=160290 RepID=A0A9N9UCW8_9HYPO|nr:unnamed protein product [Clonostachys byssicola]